MMLSVNDRIAEMRRLMQEKKIDVYYCPNSDDHLSEEYTATYFQAKSFLSGFTGDSGCLIITPTFAGLWTDGRYFTQAEGELRGTCVKLMRLRQPGVPDPIDFLISETPEKGTLGFDGRVVSTSDVQHLAQELAKKHAGIHMSDDLAGVVWGSERPAMPQSALYVLDKKYTGETAETRVARVREKMEEVHADVLILTRLEDPCWMLNLRADDIACTPVAYAFAMVSKDEVFYYTDTRRADASVRKYLRNNHVTLKEYDEIADDMKQLRSKTIWVNLDTLNAWLYSHLDTSNRIINMEGPVELFRAVKNATEIRRMHQAQIRDGVAMVNFLYWVKQHRNDGTLTELNAAEYLDSQRAAQKDFIELSFPTISAYGANAAMMHYEATKKKYSKCRAEGFLLVDSGGTYKDGTTDITRTIALGTPSEEEKRLYTLVLKGHLDLMGVKFLYGSIGNNLDILARRPLWDLDIDYQCGTGHGVGHVLAVHEGPQAIRWGVPTKARPSHVLEPGMIVTDEPGVYLPHKISIRIENDLLVVKDKKNFYGQFLKFEPMTLAPYEPEAIDVRYLDDREIEQINSYHAMVYEKLSPYLKDEVKEWLQKQTAKISR